MNLHDLLRTFCRSTSIRQQQRRSAHVKSTEVFEDRCLLTAGIGQFLGGQVLETQASLGAALGDVDGDGDLDAFVAAMNDNNDGEPADWTGAANRVFINDAGVFTDSGQALGNGISLQVELGDLDGDGDLDAFVGNVGGNKVWLNDGSGGFTDSGLLLGTGMSLDVSLGDLDGDGDLDAAVSNGAFVPGLSTAGEVWINDGAATPGFTNSASGIWGSGAFAEVALGDVDGDNDLDAVLTRFEDDNGNAGHTVVFTNDGSGTFTDSGQQLGPLIAFGLGLGDFDGDGDLDAFIADNDEEGDRVYVNQGGVQSGTEGVFVDSGQRLELGRDGFRLDIADLDGDGDLDVFAAASWYTGAEQGSRVYINQGGDQGGIAGVFASNGQQLGADDDTAVALGDIDSNGTVDALLMDFAGRHQVWLNQLHTVIDYQVTGNVTIDVPAANGVLEGTSGLSVVAVDDTDLAGAVTVNADGSFYYTPAPGFRGTDAFTVERSDGESRIVAITVGSAYWFVDASALPGGNGSAAAPFQSLAAVNSADGNSDVDEPGDLIFIIGDDTYDVASTNGLYLEDEQALLTSAAGTLSQPAWLQSIGHPLADFSTGLPTSNTDRPTLRNSVADSPVIEVTNGNFLNSLNIDPAGASEAVLGEGASGWMALQSIDVIPGPGNHSYDGVVFENSSVTVDLFNFAIGNNVDSTTTGTAFHINGGDDVTVLGRYNTRFFQRGGGLLNVTNTTNSSGEGKVVFDPDTSLSIFGGDFGFNLQNNDGGRFGFDGNFTLIDVTSGITAINSGTIEMPEDAVPAERDVSVNGGFALQVEHTSTGEDGWHLDQVNSWGGTGGILFDDVAGGGIHINQTETTSASQLAIDVSDTPNTVFDFGELMIMGDNLITDTWVGNGTPGRTGDGGDGYDAELNMPSDVTFDRDGNMYITDFAENVVRRMDVVTETMTTIAGTGTAGFSGDDGLATSAELNGPLAVVVDDEGNVFIADAGNHRIRRIDAATGIITTVAGTGTAGFGGDNGPATSASLNFPVDLAFAHDGSLFVSDHENHRIRRIDVDSGIITTAVGTGEAGISPENTPPTSAKLNLPWGIAFIANGELGIVDSGNNRMVGVDWNANEVFTNVGAGVPGNNGDQSNDPLQFQLNDPRGLAVHPDGVILITDYNNHRVVGFNPLEQSVETVGGNGSAGYAGDNMPVENAQFNEPISVAVAPWGDIAVADVLNHRVRAIFFDFSAGEGIVLEDNPGSTFNFDRLSVRATSEAFVADNSGTINVGGNHFIYGDNAMLQAENGRALDVSNTTLSNGEGGPATFRHVLSVVSPSDGIVLDNVSGDLVIESGLIYYPNQSGDPETAGIAIEGGSGDITIYATVANSTGKTIAITGRTGGDIHLVTPIDHTATGQSPVVVENNFDGSTTFYRPINASAGAAGNVVQNNGSHVVTFLTEGFPPDGDVRVFDVSPFERLETLGSLVAISGTEVDIAAGETIEFDVDLEEDQLLSGFVDSFGGSSLANLTVEVVGLTGVLTAEEFVVLPTKSIETSGTYIVRVTSDAAVTTELVLILNAALEIPDSSNGNELEIDLSDIGGPASLGSVVALSNGSTTVPDIDEFTIDLSEYVGQSIDVIVTGFEDQHYEGQTLELLAPDGTTVLAVGTATPVGGVNAANLDLAIFDFEVPTTGIYTARVTAAFDDVAYTLLVGYGLTFDSEPNNDRASDALRTIAANETGLGYLNAATDVADFYEIELTVGQTATLSTGFAFDASLSPVNTLNPELEIFRPDGTSLILDADSGEGPHAVIAFTAEETGIYVVRIGATTGSGDYLLRTTVTTPPPPPPTAFEFGDAPSAAQSGFASSYPVTLAEDGARHADAGATLGPNLDLETDGLHSANADGDDSTGSPDDEDGVTFVGGSLTAAFSIATTGTVEIDLQDPDLSSNLLDAWIDWNQDGDWLDAGEQILTSYNLGTDAGVQAVSFTIPQDLGPNVKVGTTYARFRLSSSGNLAPTGLANDGEVEDHALTIVNPAQSLTVAIAAGSVEENAGNAATTFTVTRDADITDSLTVTLTSSDETEATVVGSIVIPAGEFSSAPINIDAVDDMIIDGTQTVTVNATADGHTDGSDTIDVTNNDIPNRAPLANAGAPYRISENDSLTLDASFSSDPDGNPLTYRWDVNGDGSFDENITGVQPTLTWAQLLALGIPAEASTRIIAMEVSDGSLVDTDQAFLTIESVLNPVTLAGTVTQGHETAGTQITITATANRAVDGDQTVDVVVTGDGILASDYALSNVQITIPNGQTTGAIVFTILDDGEIEDVETATVSIANPSAGIVLGTTTANTVSIVSDDVSTLTVSLDKTSITEDGDTATTTVSRNGSTSGALVINIGSNDRSEIAFPETVTIPDGESSVTFTVTGLPDTLLDGTRTASVVATTAGFVQGIAQIDVLDTDLPELTVELSTSTITEAGSVQVTVIRNTGGEGSLGMIIVADGTEVEYPEFAEIVNNTDRVTFTIHGLADGLVDGTQTIEIYASHPGYVSIPTTLNITDLDTAQLALSFDPGTVSENGGTTTGTVTRNTDTSEAVSVNIGLSSSDATADTVVEIPAGHSSATFTVTGVDDALSNGSRDVTVTASATGFAGAAAGLTVADDDAIGLVSIVAVQDADEFESVNGQFVVEMTTASSIETQVELFVSGTATSGSDFAALPTIVFIPAGLTSATVTVPVLNDSDAENSETVVASLGRVLTDNAFIDTEVSDDTITIADNDRDLVTPTATVRTLPLSTNTSTFTVTVDLDDPASDNGQPISGAATYDLFVAVDGGDFTLYADDVPASQTTVEFTPDSNHRYWFKAVATDKAGNVEDSSPAAETNTYVGDVTAPETNVVTAMADTATGEISLNITGTDAGNSGLDRFLIYVSVDGGASAEIPASAITAGTSSDGIYSDSVVYQSLRDGAAHTYRFFTVGIDGAGNVEAAPTAATADVQLAETFDAPSGGLEANGIDVQNGETQRSYIRNVDVLFNDVNGLQALIDNDRIQIERFDLDDNTPDAGTGSLVSPTSASVNGNAIKLDFGSTGLGGSGRNGNGFYRIAIDVDGDGLFDDAAFEFFRLWGDSNGDGEVTNADRTATEDVNGDGRVNSRDRSVYRRERGRKLHNDLFPELDD